MDDVYISDANAEAEKSATLASFARDMESINQRMIEISLPEIDAGAFARSIEADLQPHTPTAAEAYRRIIEIMGGKK